MQAPRFTIRDRASTLITLDFAGLATNYPYSLMLPQPPTEATLLARLDERGGTVVRPKTVTAVTQNCVCCTTLFDDGDVVRSRYVVGAGGVHSTAIGAVGHLPSVPAALGWRVSGLVYRNSFLRVGNNRATTGRRLASVHQRAVEFLVGQTEGVAACIGPNS